jgi:ATP-binding protein involved in chromosome partitioning
VKVPILGLVENMSWLKCPHCQGHIDVFSMGGGKRTATEMDIPFLGELPLDPVVRMGGDTGRPVTSRGAADERAAAFFELAKRMMERVALENAAPAPTMTVEE